eukprot:364571-Chlamydomonas_euryale.AAC.2
MPTATASRGMKQLRVQGRIVTEVTSLGIPPFLCSTRPVKGGPPTSVRKPHTAEVTEVTSSGITPSCVLHKAGTPRLGGCTYAAIAQHREDTCSHVSKDDGAGPAAVLATLFEQAIGWRGHRQHPTMLGHHDRHVARLLRRCCTVAARLLHACCTLQRFNPYNIMLQQSSAMASAARSASDADSQAKCTAKQQSQQQPSMSWGTRVLGRSGCVEHNNNNPGSTSQILPS